MQIEKVIAELRSAFAAQRAGSVRRIQRLLADGVGMLRQRDEARAELHKMRARAEEAEGELELACDLIRRYREAADG